MKTPHLKNPQNITTHRVTGLSFLKDKENEIRKAKK